MTIKIFVHVILFMFFTACSGAFKDHEMLLDNYKSNYINHTCDFSNIDENIKEKQNVLLWALLGGSLARNCKDFNLSNSYFDLAEDYYKQNVELKSGLSDISDAAVSVLINDEALDYQANVYESIMLNTYKALNYLSMGDLQATRVEFNRALDRQRRAKLHFRKHIDQELSKLKAEHEKDRLKDDKNLHIFQNENEEMILQKYQSDIFADFKAYQDFINPFSTYMAGLFFYLTKDYQKARDLLKESFAMQSKNPVIKNDFLLVKNPKKSNKKYIWLIYENGFSASKSQWQLQIPLMKMADDKGNWRLYNAAIALPTFSPGLSDEALSLNGIKSQSVANMDNIIKTEFNIKLPFIISKAVARTITKTILQHVAYNEGGRAGGALGALAAGLVMDLYTSATNKADTRSWKSLPFSFEVARTQNKGKVQIKNAFEEFLLNQKVPKDKNILIFVRTTANNSPQMAFIEKLEF